jgi:hypothetical protein
VLVEGDKQTIFGCASDELADFGVQDAVFCLKTYSIAAMLPRLATLVGPAGRRSRDQWSAPVVFLQGGWKPTAGGRLPRFRGAMLPPSRHPRLRVCGGGGQRAGVVKHTAGRLFILGEPDRTRSARANA